MNDDSTDTQRIAWMTPVAAGVMVIAFAVLCGVMLHTGLRLAENEQFRWDRALFVFNAVQAIALAAAGALLGTTVQGVRVKDAETRAAGAEADAKLNAEDAAKARAARDLIDGLQPPGGGKSAASVEALEAVLR
jgi:hypothetical protein